MQKVDVPILANTECQQWYKDEKKSLVIVDTSLCAGLEKGGKDSCQVMFLKYNRVFMQIIQRCLCLCI